MINHLRVNREGRNTMATLKYSRQRESIKEFLRTRTDHPTADVVYENMKLIYPNISLGTVYRNLSLLADLGEIKKLSPERITLTGGPRGTATSCVSDVSGSSTLRAREFTTLWILQVRTSKEKLLITVPDSSACVRTA